MAAYIREHSHAIAREWAQATRDQVPTYCRIEKRTLIRNQEWNAEVVAHLIETGRYPRDSKYIATLAEMRFRYDFSIGEVIRAILISRDLLEARLDREGMPDVRTAVGQVMERLLTDFAEEYHTLQVREEKRRSEELVRVQEQVKRHELERQVQHAEKLASIGQLTAGLAHEIGTPLNIISGNAEYILMHLAADHPRCVELHGIVRETQRIAGMIHRLLDFARPTRLSVEPFDVNQLVRNTAAMLERQAEKAGVEIRLVQANGLPAVTADRGQIEQVFINLGLNAVHAMPEGGVLTITTRCSRKHGAKQGGCRLAAITFKDTGPGVPAKLRQEIFKPFFSTKPAGKGTGLGLAVSERIVRDHGGDIRVTGRSGQGATFTVRLPIERGPANA